MLSEKITKKTKAIMVVDYAGVPMDIKRFQEIEKKIRYIPIIEDGAHAFGASFKSDKIGNHFNYTVLSFKLSSTLQPWMVVLYVLKMMTNSKKLS